MANLEVPSSTRFPPAQFHGKGVEGTRAFELKRVLETSGIVSNNGEDGVRAVGVPPDLQGENQREEFPEGHVAAVAGADTDSSHVGRVPAQEPIFRNGAVRHLQVGSASGR